MINQKLIVENLPQAFSPNSIALKKLTLQNAHEALQKAKTQKRPVTRVKQGLCAFSFEKEKIIKNKRPTIADKGLLTTRMAADHIGTTPYNILEHKKKGKIEGIKIKSRLYFTLEELERFNLERVKN